MARNKNIKRDIKHAWIGYNGKAPGVLAKCIKCNLVREKKTIHKSKNERISQTFYYKDSEFFTENQTCN